MAGPERFTKKAPGRPRRIAVGRARPIDHDAPAAVDLTRRETRAQQAVGHERDAPGPGGGKKSAQPVAAVRETAHRAPQSLHLGRDLRRRPGTRTAIEERRDQRAGPVRGRVLGPGAAGPGGLDGHPRCSAIAQHEDPYARGSDGMDDIAAALPWTSAAPTAGLSFRAAAPAMIASNRAVSAAAAAGAAPGSSAARVSASGRSSLAAAARRAEGIDRFQALAVATVVVVVVGDGRGEAEPPRPPLDAIGGPAEESP